MRYAKETGREDDFVIFNKESTLKFNFLKYEMERSGDGAGDVLNAIKAIMNLNEQIRVYQSGGSGNNEERFWDNSIRRLTGNVISLLRLANEEVSVMNMRKIVANSLLEEEVKVYEHIKETIATRQDIDPNKRLQAQSDLMLWAESNYCIQILEKINTKSFKPSEEEEVTLIEEYWIKDFARLSERTRSIIVESFMGIIQPFMNRGILKNQFSSGLSPELWPENIITRNKIVIIDFPIKEFDLAGVYAATIYKTTFQAAMERRNIKNEPDPKPAVLWIDEYQSFCNPNTDSQFQATARSAGVATVYITQNI